MSTIDRAAIVEQAAQTAWDAGSPLSLKRWAELDGGQRKHSIELEDAGLMLPVIAKALLAPLRELVTFPALSEQGWEHFIRAADLIALLDAIEAEVQP